MIVKKYTDWQNIFLDTSVILSLFRSLRDNGDDACNFVNKLLGDLSTKQSSSKKERTFFISSITISEILEKSETEQKAAKIVKALNSENVTFYHKFYRAGTLGLGEHPDLLCFWRIKTLK
jgi:hypothetical protein